MQAAQAAGFLDPQQITIDTTSGIIGGAIAYPVSSALTQAARSLGLLDTTIQVDPVWTVQYLPNSRSLIAYVGRTAITIPQDVYNAYLVILTKEGPDRAARWLFNQVRTHAGEYLEEQTDVAQP